MQPYRVSVFVTVSLFHYVMMKYLHKPISQWKLKTTDTKEISIYKKWLEQYGHKYIGSSSLFNYKNDEVKIHWKIDEEKGLIQLAVAVKAKGWIGVGIAEAGGMPGSDIVMFTVSTNEIGDYYVKESYAAPLLDECQDWIMIRSVVEHDLIIVEVERKLNTNDHQDRAIRNDKAPELSPHKIIAAWGNSDEMSFHGYNCAKGSVKFYGNGSERNIFIDMMEKESQGYLFLSMDQYLVPPKETTYNFFNFSASSLGLSKANEFHIVGLEAIIDDEPNCIHHILLYGSTSEIANSPCRPGDSQFADMIWGWTPGTGNSILPISVGIPIGGNSGYKSFCLSVHFHNPLLINDIVVNSGIRIYHTTNLRPNIGSLLVLGDVYVENIDTPIGDGISEHSFLCPNSCTEQYFLGNVTVFREYFHMHRKGMRVVNTQYRDGKQIREGIVDYFDFSQSGAFAPPQEKFIMKRGDSFDLKCYYTAGAGDVFGYESEDEMCIAYLWYYPAKELTKSSYCIYNYDKIPQCKAEYYSKILEYNESLGRLFGTSKDSCA